MTDWIDLTVARDFAIALAIGALVGIEREMRKKRSRGLGGSGIRTFILFALAGAVSAWLAKELGSPWIMAATVLAVAAIIITGYLAQVRGATGSRGMGLTTEIAGLVVCLLGCTAVSGYPEIAVGLGIVTSATLAFKQPLHGLVEKIGTTDIYAGIRLLIATFIVLPLLPNETIDPWDALNPYKLWLLVILIASLSLIGYVATRLLGTHRGLAITGLTGGLVSSTAVTLAFARRSREPDLPADGSHALATGLLLAWGVMFVRVLVEVAVVNHELLPRVAVPLGVMAAVTAILAGLHYWKTPPQSAVPEAGAEVELKNPFSMIAAIKFGLFFAAVLFIVKIVQEYFTGAGLLIVAGLAGLTDVDAITLSMAEYALGGGEPHIAAWGIVLAALTNTLVKCGLLLVLAGPSLRARALVATGVILASGIASMLLF